MIEDRNLAVGTKLVAHFKKADYLCLVEEEDGKTVFVVDGKKYSSPSSAGSAVMGGTACNGWRFWSIEGATSATATTVAPRGRTKADSAKPAAKAARKPKARASAKAKLIRPMDNQEDVPEGQVRYWCAACQDAFLGIAGETPSQCPNGHRVDDPEFAAIIAEPPLAEATAAE